LLEKVGYKVDSVATGSEAVEAVQRKQYGLVLMDGQMPEMDGFEATLKIRQLESEVRSTPIIAMTAHAMKGDRERFLEAGMDDYIPKPLEPDALFALIEKWIWERQLKAEGQSEPEATGPEAAAMEGLLENPEAMDNAPEADLEAEPAAEDELPAWLPEDLLTPGFQSEPETDEVTAWIQEHIPPFSDPILEEEEPSKTTNRMSPDPEQKDHGMQENDQPPGATNIETEKITKGEITIPAAGLPPVDIESALPRFYFDRQFFVDMFGVFVANLPDQLAELSELIAKGKTPQLAQFAHDLKGSAANFSANKLRSLAFALAQASEGNRMDEAKQLILQMEAQQRVLEEYLAKLKS
jgi:CheY-like chemotaxis protein